MERSSRAPFRLRCAIAAVVALLVSVSALALPRPSGNASVCPMSGAPACCCMSEDASGDSTAGCCRLSTPEETAPSVQSSGVPALAAPAEMSCEPTDPSLTASLAGKANRVAPRARSAPLFLLFSVLLV